VIHALTGGGPAKATETLIYKVYTDGVMNLDLGGSSAQSVILMVVVITLTLFSSASSSGRCTTDGHTQAFGELDSPLHPDHGRVVFAFPIYFALIGSTHDAATIATGRMPLLPGATCSTTTGRP